jgi:23S rRNA pseudouridine1911/1915/1917 synthase
MRLDTWLSRLPGAPSRNRVQQLVKDCLVLVNGRPIKASYEIEGGETVEITWPEPDDPWPYPQEIPIDVLHEDDDVLVINKQANLVVHPSAGHPDGTLVNGLIHRYPELPAINGARRPGIVHRLDRDTTGLLVVARSDRAMKSLAKQLADRTMSRRYIAMALGDPAWKEILVDAAIGRDPVNRLKRRIDGGFPKPARSRFTVLRRSGQFVLLGCALETGRTHQIRIHLQHINHPIVCDEIYEGHMQRVLERLAPHQHELKRAFLHFNRPLLHARTLEFIHPGLNRRVSFQAPPPPETCNILRLAFGDELTEIIGTRQVSYSAGSPESEETLPPD